MPAHPYNFSDDLYSTLLASVSKWCAGTPQMITTNADLLVYINRAQKHIEGKQILNPLLKISALTITDSTASVPSDFRKFLDMRADSDGDGVYEYPYFIGKDFEFVRTFAKATGWTISLLFHVQTNRYMYDPIYLIYQKALEKFTGTGDEYLYFPIELMDAATKLLIAKDSGEVGSEYVAIRDMFNDLYRDFTLMCNDRNNKTYRSIPDIHGNPIQVDFERLS